MRTYLAVFRILIAASGLILVTEFFMYLRFLDLSSLKDPFTSTFCGGLKTTFFT